MNTQCKGDKMRRLPIVLILAVLVVGCKTIEKRTNEKIEMDTNDGWVDLFDGESFHGWRLRGGDADIYIEDGMIINNAIMGSPSTILATEKYYDDFILTFEVKTVGVINSGMNFRGHVWEKDTEVESVSGSLKTSTKLREAGTMWAYQAEVDATDRAWTGGLYEGGNRGWLVPLNNNEPARKAYKRGDWNSLKVKAQGNHIQIWINGVLAVDTTDDNSSTGFIGMQNHGVSRENQPGMKTMWRNIRIKEL